MTDDIEIEQPESTEPDDLDAEPDATDDGPRPMAAGNQPPEAA